MIPEGWIPKKLNAEMASIRVYQKEEMVADFRKRKVTDCKLKKRTVQRNNTNVLLQGTVNFLIKANLHQRGSAVGSAVDQQWMKTVFPKS